MKKMPNFGGPVYLLFHGSGHFYIEDSICYFEYIDFGKFNELYGVSN